MWMGEVMADYFWPTEHTEYTEGIPGNERGRFFRVFRVFRGRILRRVSKRPR